MLPGANWNWGGRGRDRGHYGCSWVLFELGWTWASWRMPQVLPGAIWSWGSTMRGADTDSKGRASPPEPVLRTAASLQPAKLSQPGSKAVFWLLQ